MVHLSATRSMISRTSASTLASDFVEDLAVDFGSACECLVSLSAEIATWSCFFAFLFFLSFFMVSASGPVGGIQNFQISIIQLMVQFYDTFRCSTFFLFRTGIVCRSELVM